MQKLNQEIRYKIVYQSRFTSFFKTLAKEKPSKITTKNNCNEEPNFMTLMSKKEMRKLLHPIDADLIKKGEEQRTTVVLKNICKKLKMPDLLKILQKNGIENYDVIYFPLKRKSLKNFGFAFINFVDSTSILKFYEAFNAKLEDPTAKPYEVFYCHTQGAKKIKKNYASKFLYFSGNNSDNIELIPEKKNSISSNLSSCSSTISSSESF